MEATIALVYDRSGSLSPVAGCGQLLTLCRVQVRVHLQARVRVGLGGRAVPRRGRVPRQPARVPPRPLSQHRRLLHVPVRARLRPHGGRLLRRRGRVRRRLHVQGLTASFSLFILGGFPIAARNKVSTSNFW